MSFPLSLALNITQQTNVLNVLHDFTADSVVSMVLLESFLCGACNGGLIYGSYLLWFRHKNTTATIALLWFLYALLVAHWSLSLKQLSRLISGRAVNLQITIAQFYGADPLLYTPYADNQSRAFYNYAKAWVPVFPLAVGTALLGFSTVLLAIMLVFTYRKNVGLLHWRSMTLFIPAVSTVMYTVSLSSWAVTLDIHKQRVKEAQMSSVSYGYLSYGQLFLTASLAINFILSDAIVLWRMTVVWGKTRSVIALSLVLLLATTAVSVANVVESNEGLSGIPSTADGAFSGYLQVGLVALSMSLASNVCATLLVGIKTWLHRKQLSECTYFANRRTFVQLVMELIVDSGVVYTAIWVLYLVSQYRSISMTFPIGEDNYRRFGFGIDTTTVDYLNTAMAQLTTIYPLAVFLLVSMGKDYRENGPQALRTPSNSHELKTVSIGLHIQPSTNLSPELPLGSGSGSLEESRKEEVGLVSRESL